MSNKPRGSQLDLTDVLAEINADDTLSDSLSLAITGKSAARGRFDNFYLNKSGGTMTGDLIINAASPEVLLQVAGFNVGALLSSGNNLFVKNIKLNNTITLKSGETDFNSSINIAHDGTAFISTQSTDFGGVEMQMQGRSDRGRLVSSTGSYIDFYNGFINSNVSIRGAAPSHANAFTNLSYIQDNYVPLAGNASISGNKTFTGTTTVQDLIVSGTTTTVNSNEVNIADSIILLNSDETGTPSENGGIEVERGTSTNAQMVWSESGGEWVGGLVGGTAGVILRPELTSELAGKANTSHNHAASNITSGTFNNARISSANVTQHLGDYATTAQVNAKENAFSKNTAFNKNFGTASGTVTQGNDLRLSDARTPTAHTHSIADVTSLQTSLNAKANTASPSFTGNLSVGGNIYASGDMSISNTTPILYLNASAGTTFNQIAMRFSNTEVFSMHSYDTTAHLRKRDRSTGNYSATLTFVDNDAATAQAGYIISESDFRLNTTGTPANNASATSKSYVLAQVGAKANVSHNHAASDITSGTLDDARIPSLHASKITTGTIPDERIQSLNASKITAGVLATARIPSLDASIITTGSLNGARIATLNASKLTSGILDDDRIPGLNASKITAGTFNNARISSANVTQHLGGYATTSQINGKANISGQVFTGNIEVANSSPYITIDDTNGGAAYFQFQDKNIRTFWMLSYPTSLDMRKQSTTASGATSYISTRFRFVDPSSPTDNYQGYVHSYTEIRGIDSTRSDTLTTRGYVDGEFAGKENAFSKNSAFNKNFGTTSGTVTQGNDSRLSNARTPTAHSHSINDVTSLQTSLNAKVNNSGNEAIGGLKTFTNDHIEIDTSGNAYVEFKKSGTRTGYIQALSGGLLFVTSSSGAKMNMYTTYNIFTKPVRGVDETNTASYVTRAGINTLVNAKENAFSKNSAFNKNFGTTSGTVTQGNDSRLSDARTPTAHTHNANNINAGVLADARIPSLNASKITAGTFNNARISSANVTQHLGDYATLNSPIFVNQIRTPKMVVNTTGQAILDVYAGTNQDSNIYFISDSGADKIGRIFSDASANTMVFAKLGNNTLAIRNSMTMNDTETVFDHAVQAPSLSLGGSSSTAGQLKLFESASNGSSSVTIEASFQTTQTYTIRLPGARPTANNQALKVSSVVGSIVTMYWG